MPERCHRLASHRLASKASLPSLSSLGCATFAISTYALHCLSVDVEKNAALFRSQVPNSYVEWPAAAFGATLVLNFMNLAFAQQLTRFTSNLLLLFINSVGFATNCLICFEATPVWLAGNGRAFHPLRYFQWLHSTPTIIFMMWLACDPEDVPYNKMVLTVIADVVMILTGLLATWLPGIPSIANGVASFVAFGLVLYYMHAMIASSMSSSQDSETRNMLRALLVLMLVMWSSFPVIWLLTQAQLISPATENLLWGLSDWFTKAVFSSQLWQSNVASAHERHEAALLVWENNNRIMVVDKLRQMVKAKEQMVHVISHELRTPILGIIALAGSLLRAHKLKPAQKERFLAMIRSTSTCLLNIINTLLSSATEGEVQQEADLQAVALRPLVDEVCGLIRSLVREEVAVVNSVPPDLPMVAADRVKLQQIMFNLLGNASRFTHAGSIRVSASVVEERQVQVSVVDTGVGVAQDQLEAIFKPYEQGSAEMAASYGGTGLGLYMVKLALDAHHSTIVAESKLGKGTSFHFNLEVASPSMIADTVDRNNSSNQRISMGSSFSRSASRLTFYSERLAKSSESGHRSEELLSEQFTGTKRSSADVTMCNRIREEGTGSGEPMSPRAQLTQTPAVDKDGAAAEARPRRSSAPAKDAPSGGAPDTLVASSLTRALKVPHRYTSTRLQARLGLATTGGRRSHRCYGRGYEPSQMQELQIMSVDDDIINQVVAEQLLAAQSWRVLKAEDGQTCLDLVEAAKVLPDLILLDVMMPGMSGYEVCARLRKKYSSALLPIIMVSARSAEKDVVQALRVGADDYVTKPYKRAELTERIKAHVRARDAAKGFDDIAAGVLDFASASGDSGADAAPSLLAHPSCILLVAKLSGLAKRLHVHQLAAGTANDSPPSKDPASRSGNSGTRMGRYDSGAEAATSSGPPSLLASSHAFPFDVLGCTVGSAPPCQTNSGKDVAAAMALMEQLQQTCRAEGSPATAMARLSPTTLLIVIPVQHNHTTPGHPGQHNSRTSTPIAGHQGSQQQAVPPPTSTWLRGITLGLSSSRPAHHSSASNAASAPEHLISWCSSLLQQASGGRWSDDTPMSLSLVMHCGPSQLLLLPQSWPGAGGLQHTWGANRLRDPAHAVNKAVHFDMAQLSPSELINMVPASLGFSSASPGSSLDGGFLGVNTDEGLAGVAAEEGRAPPAPPLWVAPCLPSAAWLLNLVDQGAPGCVLATSPAHACLSQQVVWQPWPHAVPPPEAQLRRASVEVPQANGAGATSGSQLTAPNQLQGGRAWTGTATRSGSAVGMPALQLHIAEVGAYRAMLLAATKMHLTAQGSSPDLPHLAAASAALAFSVGSDPSAATAAGNASAGGFLSQRNPLLVESVPGAAAAAAAHSGSLSLAATQQLLKLETKLDSARGKARAAAAEAAALRQQLEEARLEAVTAVAERNMMQRMLVESLGVRWGWQGSLPCHLLLPTGGQAGPHGEEACSAAGWIGSNGHSYAPSNLFLPPHRPLPLPGPHFVPPARWLSDPAEVEEAAEVGSAVGMPALQLHIAEVGAYRAMLLAATKMHLTAQGSSPDLPHLAAASAALAFSVGSDPSAATAAGNASAGGFLSQRNPLLVESVPGAAAAAAAHSGSLSLAATQQLLKLETKLDSARGKARAAAAEAAALRQQLEEARLEAVTAVAERNMMQRMLVEVRRIDAVEGNGANGM
ncbi:hypothetical protein QJQ45_018497 [Haematococcus lacustris]|nr:hypothetical protein QJQ45_018497 [Haematococcus lacustris]